MKTQQGCSKKEYPQDLLQGLVDSIFESEFQKLETKNLLDYGLKGLTPVGRASGEKTCGCNIMK